MRALVPVLLALAFAAPAAAQTCGSTAGVPSFAVGAQPAGDEQVSAYLSAVGAASSRVITGVAGTSVQGRPLPYALVSSPHNLARLNAIAARVRASRAGHGFAAGGPAIVWLAANVHGNEPSGTDADLQVLSDLAHASSCALLDRLVVGILPVQNPDGRAAGTRENANGFDLNRDWFAATQPETVAKLRLLARYPPLAFADQHEEGGTGFFFPPNADPIHHEIPHAALQAIAGTIGPALATAFRRAGDAFMTRAGYDLFFMGYGDSATTTLFGAAGMTFEKGADAPFDQKAAEHHLAATTLLHAVAAHRHALLRAWDRGWRTAQAEGRRGHPDPYAYAWRADLASADAARLASRLRSVGVRVNRLRRALWVRFHAYGVRGTHRSLLPIGTWVVTLAQTQKHWVEAMLGENPDVSVPYFYDVASWSNPLLMGLDGGAIRSPLPRGSLGPGAIARGGAARAFPGDSEGSAEAAMELLGRGIALARVPASGTYVLPDGVDATAVLSAHRVPSLPIPPPGAVPLRAPSIAMLDLDGPSASWMRWLLEQRYGLAVDELSAGDIAAGRLAGHTALVVPDGTAPALSPDALSALQAWVRGGGTYIGERGEGIAVARSAAVTAVTAKPPADSLMPGVSLRVHLDITDPVAWGENPRAFDFATADPVLTAPAGATVAAYPTGSSFFAGGYAHDTADLHGTAAVTDEAVGAGRAILFAYDPAFRGYVEGTERLVANALLAPPTGAAATRARPVGTVRSVVPPLSEDPRRGAI
jgi:Zinc carboxypeptidase